MTIISNFRANYKRHSAKPAPAEKDTIKDEFGRLHKPNTPD